MTPQALDLPPGLTALATIAANALIVFAGHRSNRSVGKKKDATRTNEMAGIESLIRDARDQIKASLDDHAKADAEAFSELDLAIERLHGSLALAEKDNARTAEDVGKLDRRVGDVERRRPDNQRSTA